LLGIFLQPWARALVVLHALSAIVLLGSSTHSAAIAVGTLRGHARPRLARLHTTVVAVSYATTMLLGALAYPTYRYQVRGLFLDRYAPWASNLFDIKEGFAAIGLPLALGASLLRGFADPDSDRRGRAPYAITALGTAALVWFSTVAGLVITLEKAV
jgi:hypothetical protein